MGFHGVKHRCLVTGTGALLAANAQWWDPGGVKRAAASGTEGTEPLVLQTNDSLTCKGRTLGEPVCLKCCVKRVLWDPQ